jgi:hypothetical protein
MARDLDAQVEAFRTRPLDAGALGPSDIGLRGIYLIQVGTTWGMTVVVYWYDY